MRPVGAGHGDPRWLEAVVEQAGVLSHTSNLFHTAPQVRRGSRGEGGGGVGERPENILGGPGF